MTREEKLAQLRALKDPSYALASVVKKVVENTNLIKGEVGPVGPKPIKGVDYFTPQEIEQIISYVRSLVKDGKDSTVPGPEGKQGKPGTDGLAGISPSVDVIVRDVLNKIPKPKDGVSPDSEKIVKQVTEELNKKKISFKDISDINDLVAFLKLGGFRGGGGGGTSTTTFKQLTDVPQTYVGQANKAVTVKADETGLQFVTPSGTGTVTNFTFTNSTGITGTVTTSTTTPALALALTTAGVAASTNKNYVTDAQAVVIGNTSGTNTGDQTSVSGNAGTVTTNANLTGPVTSAGNATTIAAGVVTLANMANMATASVIYRKTAAAGVPEVNTLATLKTDLVLVKADVGLGNVDNTSDVTKNAATVALTNKDLTGVSNTFPTFNQNTTGSAATLTTPRTIAGVSFNGSANISIASTNLSDTASIALLTSTQTFTNKRNTLRIGTETSSATSTPTADTVDQWNVTALAVADAFAAPTGTPTDGQKLMIRIKDNATARALTWNAIYRASTDLALPSTTIISKTLYLGFVYNSADSKWDLIALLNNF